jgi:hypothetical protein
MRRQPSSRWPAQFFSLLVFLMCFAVTASGADAKQVVTGHAEVSGTHGNVATDHGVDVFSHKNFARVRFICQATSGSEAGLRVTNLENKSIRVTYTEGFTSRRSDVVKPGDSETFTFNQTDVGITDLSHKYAPLNIDWGLRRNDSSCDYAVHSILHFPNGTPLNG